MARGEPGEDERVERSLASEVGVILAFAAGVVVGAVVASWVCWEAWLKSARARIEVHTHVVVDRSGLPKVTADYITTRETA